MGSMGILRKGQLRTIAHTMVSLVSCTVGMVEILAFFFWDQLPIHRPLPSWNFQSVDSQAKILLTPEQRQNRSTLNDYRHNGTNGF